MADWQLGSVGFELCAGRRDRSSPYQKKLSVLGFPTAPPVATGQLSARPREQRLTVKGNGFHMFPWRATGKVRVSLVRCERPLVKLADEDALRLPRCDHHTDRGTTGRP